MEWFKLFFGFVLFGYSFMSLWVDNQPSSGLSLADAIVGSLSLAFAAYQTGKNFHSDEKIKNIKKDGNLPTWVKFLIAICGLAGIGGRCFLSTLP